MSSSPGSGQAAGREAADRAPVVIERAELGPIAVGLLEVRADPFVVETGLCSRRREPTTSARRSWSAMRLVFRQARVCSIADEDVLEAEGLGAVDARSIASDQLPAHQ